MDVSRKIILNLALRYRSANQQYMRIGMRFGVGSNITSNALWRRTEAWNSYQAAKQIYYGEQQ